MPQTLTTDLRKNSTWALTETALEHWTKLSYFLPENVVPEFEQLYDILWELRRRVAVDKEFDL